MRVNKLFLIPLALLLVSCASTEFEGKAVMTGRVCDEKGRAVPNYHISAGIGKEAITDSSGMFVIRDVSSGMYHIKGGGSGWCGTDFNFHFYDRKDIVCIQVVPLDSLLEKIEAKVGEDDFSGAEEILKRSKAGNEKNPLFDCYKNLIKYCEAKTEKSRKRFLASVEKI